MSSNLIARFDLPVTMCREIGRIIVRFAYVEHYLQGIIYMLVGVNRGIGKLAIREPRAIDRVELILDLIAVRDLIPPPKLQSKDFKEALEDAEDIRNLCAHGAWTWSAPHEAWAVMVERGQWQGVPKTDRVRRNKRLLPEGQIVRVSHLRTYVRGLDALALMLREIQANLEAQLKPSPQKHL